MTRRDYFFVYKITLGNLLKDEWSWNVSRLTFCGIIWKFYKYEIIAWRKFLCEPEDEISTEAKKRRADVMSYSINEFSLHPKFHVLLGKIPKLNRSSPGGKFLSRLLQDVKLIFHNFMQLNLERVISPVRMVNLFWWSLMLSIWNADDSNINYQPTSDH